MIKRILGNSDLEITVIGFGAWAIGGGNWAFAWGSQDDNQSIKTIHKALDHGINWIDTAAVYGLGHSEKIVAKALKGTNYNPYVFTKCGLKWDEKGATERTLSRERVLKEVEDSLRRLEVDVIDLYQIHWPTTNDAIKEAWETMAEIKEKGLVKNIGVSNFSVDQIKLAEEIAPVASLQPPYSMIFPQVADEILPYCRAQNIGTIIYSPMASGLLTGKMTKERIENMPEDDWRKRNDRFQEPKLSFNLNLASLLTRIGQNYGSSAGAVAVAWTLLNPAVTAAIVGMRKPDQVDDVVKGGDLKLDPEDINRINAFLKDIPS